ncbi:unnamed protein product [Gongylonema pulchrum]|uniref:NAD(+) kinase n=1 Tax=Gongylonema pulchrum TaxID=637853 RepID=A0A183E7V7_9BILA|nr:unnamed protein product [Gongylonema pulchrum]
MPFKFIHNGLFMQKTLGTSLRLGAPALLMDGALAAAAAAATVLPSSFSSTAKPSIIQRSTELTRRGSNYQRLRKRHEEHQQFLNIFVDELRSCGIETRTVQRFDYNDAAVSWADAVFSAGGDGTFLLAASKILSPDKPVIGINTDPIGSEGHLCLLKKLSHEYIKDALKRLLDGDFR